METIYDAIIVGGGPAGLAAAIYLARAKYSVLVLEKEKFGGQITITSEIVNYPGVLEDSGTGLTQKMRQQAEHFGARFQLCEVQSLQLEGSIKKVKTDKGELSCVGLVLATGAHPRQLGFPGEKTFQGRGIAYCATCDGEFFEGCELFVIGGGFAACEEAVFLTQYATKVTMIVREEDFTAAKSIADETREHPKIECIFETEIIEAGGEDSLEYAVFRNNRTGETWRYEASEHGRFGIFVFAGYVPANELFKDQLELNQGGYLVTDRHQATNIAGVYGAGDICEKDLRQVVTAVSDGALAATALEKYISKTCQEEQIETIKIQKTPQPKVKHVDAPLADDRFISQEIIEQLAPILARLDHEVTLKVAATNDDFGLEMKQFASEFAALNDHIHLDVRMDAPASPYIEVLGEDQDQGIIYHLVPGGHEFNSFVLAVYFSGCSTATPLESSLKQAIQSLDPHRLDLYVSLSCTMCPELVQACQRLAIENAKIHVSIFDINHFPQKKEEYKIMSVPCLVIDEKEVTFGKKNLETVLALLKA